MRLRVERQRALTVGALALPIIGGMMSQNLLNLVDTAMVGAVGENALAAVGISGFTNFMAVAVITGLSAGVQAIAARRVGEGKLMQAANGLNAGLVLAFAMGLPLAITLFLLVPTLFPYLVNDPDVVAEGVPYLQARLCGIVAVGMNFSFRGFWNGIGWSRVYLRTLLVMHASNIVISYCLIFGKLGMPELGTLGAGLGTTISVYIGTFYYFWLGLKRARAHGFLDHAPPRQAYGTLLRLAVPSSLQQFFFAAGLTMMFWIIGRIGTTELAVASVLINLTLLAILPGIGMGIAAASLVGQALGRGDADDARQWGWDVSLLGALLLGLIGLPMLLVPELLLAGFLHDPATRAVGILPLQLVGLGIALDGVGLVLMHALLGAGASKWVMLVSLGTQWLFFLPLAYLLGPVLGYGLIAVWLLNLGYRGLQAGLFAGLWRWAPWAAIKV